MGKKGDRISKLEDIKTLMVAQDGLTSNMTPVKGAHVGSAQADSVELSLDELAIIQQTLAAEGRD